MIKLPIGIAEKLQQMLDGQPISSSNLKHAAIDKMVEDGTIQTIQTANNKRKYYVQNKDNFMHNLKVDFGINDLQAYITAHASEELTRARSVEVSSDSKLKKRRTFTGFLVNTYEPIEAMVGEVRFLVAPQEGSYTFIYDYKHFTIPMDVTVVGIENPENFEYIRQQPYLFTDIKPLFVCRYPQSGDLIDWLQRIPNHYLHFGDFDFEGINIFLQTYEKHLGERASFFVPKNISDLIKKYGNRNLYDRQLHHAPKDLQGELDKLLSIIHQYKKGLEQEVLIARNSVT